MKQLIRIMGRHGVVYEERMTEGQITQFLQLREERVGLGVAFEEWEITIMVETAQTTHEREREDTTSQFPACLRKRYKREDNISLPLINC